MGANASLPGGGDAATPRVGDAGTLPRHSALHAPPLHGDSSAAGLLMRAAADAAAAAAGKKKSRLATLRKRLTCVRRGGGGAGGGGRCHDNGRAVRELTATWTVRELHALADEYDAAAALKVGERSAHPALSPQFTIHRAFKRLIATFHYTDTDFFAAKLRWVRSGPCPCRAHVRVCVSWNLAITRLQCSPHGCGPIVHVLGGV